MRAIKWITSPSLATHLHRAARLGITISSSRVFATLARGHVNSVRILDPKDLEFRILPCSREQILIVGNFRTLPFSH